MSINFNDLINFRKHLHSIPELSGKEKITSATVIEFIKKCNPDEIISDVGGFGIIATWSSGKEGKEIIFRSELDALFIEETNEFEYRSVNKNVSHKCGHDGHTAILCGVAQYLKSSKPAKGQVRLLFQPSEETGEGAMAMLQDDKSINIDPDFIFALHNLPGYTLNEILIKDNIFTASVNSMIINLFGIESHAAEPQQGINPALAVSKILQECLLMDNNDPEHEEMKVITPVFIELGEKSYGISAGKASIHVTLRCWNDQNLRKFEQEIKNKCREISLDQGVKVEFEYLQTFYASNNDPSAVNIVRNVGNKLGLKVTEKKYPFKWGEDFGLFTSRYKGCMFGLGAGEKIPVLHNPDYDFPDELLKTGVELFTGIIEELTN